MNETPRTDAAWDAEWQAKALDPNADPAHGMCDFAMQLERELTQYQAKHTAIMQEADRRYDEQTAELTQAQIELKRTKASLDCAEENFHVTNQAYVKADAERAQAQARCAEVEKAACCPDEVFERMEKDAARYRWAKENLIEWYPKGYNGCKYARFDAMWPNDERELDAAIDAALKETR